MVEELIVKHVSLKITPEEKANFLPPKGINIIFYPYRTGNEYCDATLTACPIDPNPIQRRDQNDIDRVLSMLDVVRDKPSSMKKVNQNIHMKAETILANPGLDSEGLDFLRSKAKLKHVAYMPEAEFINMKGFFEKNKVLYDNKKLKDSEVKHRIKDYDGNKLIGLEIAQIIGNEFDIKKEEENTRSANLGLKPNVKKSKK